MGGLTVAVAVDVKVGVFVAVIVAVEVAVEVGLIVVVADGVDVMEGVSVGVAWQYVEVEQSESVQSVNPSLSLSMESLHTDSLGVHAVIFVVQTPPAAGQQYCCPPHCPVLPAKLQI